MRLFEFQYVDTCPLQVLSPGRFLLQWTGPCYAANEDISKEYLFYKTSLVHPLIFEVNADRSSALKSYWQNAPVLWTAGIPMTFALSVSDKFGNAVSSYGDGFDLVDVSKTFTHVRG